MVVLFSLVTLIQPDEAAFVLIASTMLTTNAIASVKLSIWPKNFDFFIRISSLSSVLMIYYF